MTVETINIDTSETTPEKPVEVVQERPSFELPEDLHGIAQRLKLAQKQMDENPAQGMPPKLVDHPITQIISWMFEQTGYPEPNKWVEGSKAFAIGGPVEYRNIANNEFRRILAVAEIAGKVNSFDMRYLLNRDPGTLEWLLTLQTYVIPFILEHSLLEIAPEDFHYRNANQPGL